MIRKLITTGAVLLFATLPGCMAVNRRFMELYDAVLIRCDEKRELSRIREDTRDELAMQREETRRLAAERDIEMARLQAERARLEMELCRANREQELLRVQSNLQDNMESKLAVNVRQGLEFGELEVDTEKLKELLKERENPPPQQPFTDTPRCACGERKCGCAGGQIRRLCPNCCHKPCEEDCGGPLEYQRLTEQPFREPLRPTEIPLKLPVRLTFGVQQPRIETTRIVTEPFIDQPFRDSCTKCTTGGVDGAAAVDPNAPQPPSPEMIEDGLHSVETTAERIKPIPPPINFENSF